MLSLNDRLEEARGCLAVFVGADADDLAFVPNATTGINTVLRSLSFDMNDEILVTSHTYNACRNAAAWVANRAGAVVRQADVPFPVAHPDQVVDAVLEAVTRRTRLVVLDHVTSPTGVVFPVEELIASLTDRGIDTLIDGAHAPGMISLNLRTLGATYYTGNCHKWLCSPKGAAFLWVRRDRQEEIVPLTISHGYNDPAPRRSSFRRLFDWVGTVDPTPYLCVAEAIREMGTMSKDGWPGVMAANRRLALDAADVLAPALGIERPCPDSMIGALVALPVPGADPSLVDHMSYLPSAGRVRALGFEVPIYGWPDAGSGLIRVSAQRYNTLNDYERLAGVLVEVLAANGRR